MTSLLLSLSIPQSSSHRFSAPDNGDQFSYWRDPPSMGEDRSSPALPYDTSPPPRLTPEWSPTSDDQLHIPELDDEMEMGDLEEVFDFVPRKPSFGDVG